MPFFGHDTAGRAAALAVAAIALLAQLGCSTASPPPAPSVAVPAQWSAGAEAASGAAPRQSDAWWRDLGSAELDVLVEAALQSNRDLRMAASRVAQARALLEGTDAERLPQLGLGAGVQRGRGSGADPKADMASGGFRASWELDLFGAKSLASAAAASDVQVLDQVQRAARIAVAAEVATAYLESQALSHREAVAREAVATLERQIVVARRRFEAGQLGALDIDRFVSELRQEKAHAAQLQGALRVRQQQLAVLLGKPTPPASASWSGWESSDAAVPHVPLPAELLERRPDVQRQAHAVAAAAARLGVAKRDLYPRIQLDWAGNKERLRVQGGDAATTLVVGYGVSLSLPLFDGGRIRANIAVRDAQVQEAMAEYEKAMLSALTDVEIAFAQLHAADAGVLELEQAMLAGTAAAEKSERLFNAGLTDLNTVLDVRRSQLRARDALLQARGARWVAAVSIRRALAGRV